MSKPNITEQQRQELAALAQRPDSAIDTSDIPEITDWSQAVQGRFYRPVKEKVSIRLDADVLAWFKAHHSKYQSAVNDALREYMDNHR